ncbi:thrombopoietin receptor [Danio aesculapii]|uniref:thrombopoietin receptor n=1 Tax=Danio aesculapii TaxID=1142201 RepID=UPI0024C0B097|nr:thrombopoietin receptor [Danio aesculapii]
MDPALIWWILHFCLIKQVNSEPRQPKPELLAMDEDPKCFTRNLEDFTCFWEAPLGKSYDFLYIVEGIMEEKRCDVKQQTSKEKVLNICTFPPSDVYLFVETHIRVLYKDTNTTIYSRAVSVEDQLLLYPPSNISLHPTEEVGQMLVKWKRTNNEREIRYSFKNTSTIRPVSGNVYKLVSLVPGENCTVQMRVKPSGDFKRFWSDWSSPVTAMVPQTAGDIELRCHTPDLIQIICKWRGDLYEDSRYNFYYKHLNRSSWSSWKLCPNCNNTLHQCVLYGQESSVFKFYLDTGLQPFSRTFYAETFHMNSKVQTRPPEGLKVQPEEERLCLTWDSPFLVISNHLKYQIRYQHHEENEWKDFTATGSKTSTCLDVHRGSQYTIQIRAQPNGSVYSGDWSDWSKPVTTNLPLSKEWIIFVCIPVALIIIATAVISFFSKYFRKVKSSLWPPVPNLNKVLENILTDISGSHWEPTFNIKQCDDDTATSVVEVLTEGESVVKTCKSSTCPLLSERSESHGENFTENLEMAQDYVILNNNIIPCLMGNDYAYKDVASNHLPNEKLHCCPSISYTSLPERTTDILNHSYLLLAEQSDLEEYHSTCGQYTNLEITAVSCVQLESEI